MNEKLLGRLGKIWIKAMTVYLGAVLFFFIFVSASQAMICSAKAKGVVTAIIQSRKNGNDDEYQYMLNISFTTQDGKTYEVRQVSKRYPQYQVDQMVEVHYDPSRPEVFYL